MTGNTYTFVLPQWAVAALILVVAFLIGTLVYEMIFGSMRTRTEQLMQRTEQLHRSGLQLHCGRHSPGTGYWAIFLPEKHPLRETDDTPAPKWDEAGHAKTLHEAIAMAGDIAYGVKVKIPQPNCF